MENMFHACHGNEAIVTSVKETEKKVKAPKLYDLTTLQREANRIYGMTAKQTLDTAQSLYEKKLITYPRTDSQYLTEDMEQTARNVVRQIYEKYQLTDPFDQPEQPDVKKVMNNSKVTDHHAIIPTMELASCHLGELKSWEEKILFLIAVHTQPGVTMETVCRKIADIVIEAPIQVDLKSILNYEDVKDKLFIRVSSAEANKEVLENAPHQLKEDLAITYHVAVGKDQDGLSSMFIKNDLLEQYGISAEQLHEDAMKSSPRVMAPEVSSIGALIDEMYQKNILMLTPDEREMLQETLQESSEMPTFFVVTNTERIDGAGVIFYPEFMDNMGELLGNDFFILPSSIHEMLVLPDDGQVDAEMLRDMVKEVNATQVAPAERLTNDVYHFDTKDHVFEKADRFTERQKEKEAQAAKTEKAGKEQPDQKPKAKKHDMEL